MRVVKRNQSKGRTPNNTKTRRLGQQTTELKIIYRPTIIPSRKYKNNETTGKTGPFQYREFTADTNWYDCPLHNERSGDCKIKLDKHGEVKYLFRQFTHSIIYFVEASAAEKAYKMKNRARRRYVGICMNLFTYATIYKSEIWKVLINDAAIFDYQLHLLTRPLNTQ